MSQQIGKELKSLWSSLVNPFVRVGFVDVAVINISLFANKYMIARP